MRTGGYPVTVLYNCIVGPDRGGGAAIVQNIPT